MPSDILYLAGKKYRLTREDHDAYRCIRACSEDCHYENHMGRPFPLLRYRTIFRRIVAKDATLGLLAVLQLVEIEQAQRISIWLLGRAHERLAVSTIAEFRFLSSRSVKVRREVARSLRRLEAWSVLRQMQAVELDDRVRRLCVTRPTRPLSERIDRFQRGAAFAAMPVPARPFELLATIDCSATHRPKSAQWIAGILSRIRSLVRGRA